MVGKFQLLNTLVSLSSAYAAKSLNFEETSVALNGSLYQSTYHNGTLFLTSSVGRPPINESYLFKVEADSLKVLDTKTPGYDNKTHQLWAVYGISSDPAHNNFWVTNTRQDTVSVYSDSDLSLVKHVDSNLKAHTRDVAVNQKLNQAYVSDSTSSIIEIFDSRTFDQIGSIQMIQGSQNFSGVMALDLDEEDNELFTVSLSSHVAARVDLNNNNQITYFQLGNDSARASGVAYDRSRKHLFVASQGSPEILVVDTSKSSSGQSKIVSLPSEISPRAVEGDVDTSIHVEAGNLAAAYDPKFDVVYIANRVTAEIYVIDAEALEVIHTLKTGKFPNHITVDPSGNIYVVDKGTPSKLHRYAVTGNSTTNSTRGGNSTSSGAGAGGAGSGTKTAVSGSPSGKPSGKPSGSAGAAGVAGAGASGSASASGSKAVPSATGGATIAAVNVAILIAPIAAFLI